MTEHRVPRRRSKASEYYRQRFLDEYIENPEPRGLGLHRLPSPRPAEVGERGARRAANPLVTILLLVTAVVFLGVCLLACLAVVGLVL